MKKKKIASIILATTIVSGTMLGKNIITKANTITKNKESKINEPLVDFKDVRQHIKYRLDKFEKNLNDQYMLYFKNYIYSYRFKLTNP